MGTIAGHICKAAERSARSSDVRTAKVGAVVFTDSGRIVTTAPNRRILGSKKKFTIHAEEFALIKINKTKANRRIGKLSMLVVRVSNVTPGLFMAKPCDRCRFLLSTAKINVYYSDRHGKIRRLSSE